MLFISYGLINAKSISIIVGFWLGRFLVYIIMIYVSSYFFNSFKEMLNSDIQTLILMNSVGILMTLFMLLIDWNILFSEHNLSLLSLKDFFRGNNNQLANRSDKEINLDTITCLFFIHNDNN